MTDPSPDSSTSPSAHLPWESIGAVEDRGGVIETGQAPIAQPGPTPTESEFPLTPWAERSAAPFGSDFDELSRIEPQGRRPDSADGTEDSYEDKESGATLRSAPACGEINPDPQDVYRSAPMPTVVTRSAPPLRSGGWTLPLLCAGIALVACCVLIPQADANRRLVYEKQTLQTDLQTVERQIAVNQEFLKRVADDPTLAQRLAERQMKVVPEGSRVLELVHEPDGVTMSPFQLVSVATPPPLPPYKPVGGTFARLCYDLHTRLYLIGAALGMVAVGLVMGYAPEKQ
jgi:hypothetical protein